MSDFRSGMKAAVPTALGYVAIGLAFGVVAVSFWSIGSCRLLSCVHWFYGGSAQFAIVCFSRCRS